MSYDPETYDPQTDNRIVRAKTVQFVKESSVPTNRTICPEYGVVFKTGEGVCYYKPEPVRGIGGWRHSPIRRVTHKEMPKLMTKRQVRRNVSRSRFILKHDL